MMKNALIILFVVGLSFNTFADGIQIYNGTDHVVRVKVGINNGSDCTPDYWIESCIAPFSTYTDDIASGEKPFTVRVWTVSSGCMPIWSTESWQHNLAWAMCTTAPTSNINPYSMIWYHATPTTWGIGISD